MIPEGSEKGFYFKQLKLALTTDKTTGLANQTSLYEDLTCAGKEVKLSLILMRINHFEGFAKESLKEKTDKLMQLITEILQHHLPFGAHVYRSGIDEFALVLEGYQEHEVVKFVEELHQAIHGLSVDIMGEDVVLSVSFGLVINHPADGAMMKATSALEELLSKGNEGDISIYNDTSGFNQHRMQHAKMVLEVRRSLNEGRIFPYFQPIVDIKTLKVVQYECLARMETSSGKTLLPLDFMEYMKMGGLMKQLTRTMIIQCCDYFKGTSQTFSINVTMEDLLDDAFLRFVKEQARKHRLAPSQILLEIKEDLAFTKKNSTVERIFSELRESGFKCTIDNFGRHENFLEQLDHIMCDIIKIDGKFIRDIDKSPHKEEVVKQIIQAADKNGFLVIAEHVSQNEEKKALERLGVAYVQGYLFGYPSQTTK